MVSQDIIMVEVKPTMEMKPNFRLRTGRLPRRRRTSRSRSEMEREEKEEEGIFAILEGKGRVRGPVVKPANYYKNYTNIKKERIKLSERKEDEAMNDDRD